MVMVVTAMVGPLVVGLVLFLIAQNWFDNHNMTPVNIMPDVWTIAGHVCLVFAIILVPFLLSTTTAEQYLLSSRQVYRELS